MRKAVLCFAILLSAACAKSGAVWLEIRNMSGKPVRDVSLDYGRGALTHSFMTPRMTYGDWVRFAATQPLAITYTEPSGGRRIALVKPLSPDMISGGMLVTIWPDGLVEQNVLPSGSVPGGDRWIDQHYPWIVAALGLLVLPSIMPLLTALASGAGRRPAVKRGPAKRPPAHPALAQAAARLGMSRQACPVLYEPGADEPIVWWQGKADGRMIGLLDSGMIWIGESGDKTLCVFERAASGASFAARDLAVPESTSRRRASPAKDHAAARLVSELSRGVSSVAVLADAVEASVSWSKYRADAIITDIRVLSALKSRLEELDPPLVRAVMRGHETAALAMIKTTADLEETTLGGLNALTAAVEAGSADLVTALLAAGARAKPEHGHPLHAAAHAGRAGIAAALLDAGAPVDDRDGRENTPLIEAAGEGHQEVVALLLARGADPEARGFEQATALERAESEGFTEVAAALRAAR